MSFAIELDGPRHGRAGGDAKELVIFLHGLGADGNDLIALAPLFARVLPDAAFVAPNAPFPCDMAPFGYQWFSLQNRDPDSVLGGVRATAPHLDAFIDAELTRTGLGDDRLALVGFSQGTMMALHVALRRQAACAAVIGYSGALVGAQGLAEEIQSRPPVFLAHGQADEIVPFQSMALAEQTLKANGLMVTTLSRPGLGHGIDEAGIQSGLAMLVQVLSPEVATGGE